MRPGWNSPATAGPWWRVARGILEYEEGVIRLNTTSGIVRFMGRDLTMNCLTEDSAVVSGTILSVEFLS